MLDYPNMMILEDFNQQKIAVSEVELRGRCVMRHAYGLTIHKFQVRNKLHVFISQDLEDETLQYFDS